MAEENAEHTESIENGEHEYNVEDVDAMVNALVELLVAKKVITEKEFSDVLDTYYEEE